MSESVRAGCGVPGTAAEAPQFDFDEAELRPRGMDILDAVAACVNGGSLKGITLIGHTDPRGTDAYNEALGMRRAGVAHDYLASKGVASSDIRVKSRGERDAAGNSESSYQLDRRVEIDESAP